MADATRFRWESWRRDGDAFKDVRSQRPRVCDGRDWFDQFSLDDDSEEPPSLWDGAPPEPPEPPG
ncbi:MAG: hypothetical protein ACTS27_09300, partial [Phycisphaerales bacterium]